MGGLFILKLSGVEGFVCGFWDVIIEIVCKLFISKWKWVIFWDFFFVFFCSF